MLTYLRVRGLALLEDVALELGPGLNVLTGETGAGKSIIVDALTLLRGVRPRSDLVRAGGDAATVDAVFELTGATLARLEPILERHHLASADADTLVIQRVVPRKGRGRASIQGELVPRTVLSEVGEELLDVCSQHEHQSLTHTARHADLLDAYARLGGEVAEYGAAFAAFRDALTSVEAIRRLADDSIRRVDFLKFQIDELERVNPLAGEHQELGARLTLLREAHHWGAFAATARETLSEADDSVQTRLSRLAEQARRGASCSPRLEELLAHLEAAEMACSEAAVTASRLADSLDIEPGELERAEARYFELEGLRRKHGVEPDQLAVQLVCLRDELASLEGASEQLSGLEARARELEAAARRLADALTKRRRVAAKRLSEALCTELAELHMGTARLEARVEPREGGGLGPHGQDRVEFLFSANSGEPLLPLNRVASGGELSRVLLALKGIVSTGDSVATYVFDEVDAGVGGAVAEAIGRRLARASERHQVLCITHLPQIAAFAERHFKVEKVKEGDRTLTHVRALRPAESTEEIARMLGGATVTTSARGHARALQDDARKARTSPPPALAACASPRKPRSGVGRVA